MKVAITGGTGFIGSHCVAQAVEAGHEVRMLVRNLDKARSSLAVHEVTGPVEIVEADLTDHPALRTGLVGMDALLHVGAVFSLNANDGRLMAEVNPSSTAVLLDTAVELGLDPIVYVSTVGVFYPLTSAELDADADVSTGCGPYTASKIAAERVARRHQSGGAPVTCVYPGGVIGPCDPNPDLSDSMAGLVETMKRSFFPLSADATTAFVDVRDVARVCVGALEPGRGPRRYLVAGNLCDVGRIIECGHDLTGRTFRCRAVPASLILGAAHLIDLVSRLTRRKMPFNLEGARIMTSGRHGLSHLRQSAAEADFAFPTQTFEETMADTLHWLHATGHLTDEQVGQLAV